MKVTTRLRHLIDVTAADNTITFEFDSRDIGFTQGTTIRCQGQTIAQYRPGTRHWTTALDTAEQLLTEAVHRALVGGEWDCARLAVEFAAVLQGEQLNTWDGQNSDEEDAW